MTAEETVANDTPADAHDEKSSPTQIVQRETDRATEYQVWVKERRSLVRIAMIVVILTNTIMGIGWASAWAESNNWHEQARVADERRAAANVRTDYWAGLYQQLYAWTVENTGTHPDLPTPEKAATQIPDPVDGAIYDVNCPAGYLTRSLFVNGSLSADGRPIQHEVLVCTPDDEG